MHSEVASRVEVSDILWTLGEQLERIGLNNWQLRTLRALRDCRTMALGGHIDRCDDCGKLSISYNSCRNRHCPKCQGHKRVEWINAREQELLPVPYFHVVFTLPQELNALAMQHPKAVYDTLFSASWETLYAFASNVGVQAGMISILHTWGQNLSLHPHLHCIVPGGGVDKDGRWRSIRRDGKYLFSVRALSKVFRAKFVSKLRLLDIAEPPFVQGLFSQPWVVYAKRPFGRPKDVIEYLGRYTHKIAITNRRLVSVGEQGVFFRYKDYRQGGINKQMHLSLDEFIRRFAQHILPKRFVRIRHYGILSSTWKRARLLALQQQMGQQPTKQEPLSVTHLRRCACCKTGRLQTILTFDERGPPVGVLTGTPLTASCAV